MTFAWPLKEVGQRYVGRLCKACLRGTWIRVCDAGVKAKVIVNWDRKSLIVELRRQLNRHRSFYGCYCSLMFVVGLTTAIEGFLAFDRWTPLLLLLLL